MRNRSNRIRLLLPLTLALFLGVGVTDPLSAATPIPVVSNVTKYLEPSATYEGYGGAALTLRLDHLEIHELSNKTPLLVDEYMDPTQLHDRITTFYLNIATVGTMQGDITITLAIPYHYQVEGFRLLKVLDDTVKEVPYESLTAVGDHEENAETLDEDHEDGTYLSFTFQGDGLYALSIPEDAIKRVDEGSGSILQWLIPLLLGVGISTSVLFLSWKMGWLKSERLDQPQEKKDEEG